MGIWIDRELKFSEHINYICKKISKKLGVLNRCGQYLTEQSKKTVFNTIILPHFHFASTVLYLANDNEIKRLQILQNRGMRIILKCDKYTRISLMLERLNWLDIGSLLEVNALIFIHKIKLNLAPKYLNNLVQIFRDVHDHGTRNNNNFIVQHKNTKKGQNSIFFKALLLYNQLPKNIKELNTIISFKNKIREHYFLNR